MAPKDDFNAPKDDGSKPLALTAVELETLREMFAWWKERKGETAPPAPPAETPKKA
jgi:hypothetical protein